MPTPDTRMQVVMGGAIWLLAGAFLVWWIVGRTEGSVCRSVLSQLWAYTIGNETSIRFQLHQPAPLALGDPIFIIRDNVIVQVGHVAEVSDGESRASRRARAARFGTANFYPSAPSIEAGAQLQYYSSDDSLQWVLQALLPPAKRAQLARELSATFDQHEAEIMSALQPVMAASLPEAMRVIEQDLQAALAVQKEEWVRLGSKYQRQIVEGQLAPLLTKEIWPIVLRHAEPTAQQVGREIWERASIWRFGWRSVYDRVLPKDESLVRKEWARFLHDDALPVLQRHADEFVQMQQDILIDVARNPEVRAAVGRSLQTMLQDPELQRLAWQTFRQVIFENPRLHQVLARHWTGPEAQQAFQTLSERFEPAVLRIATLLFGSAERGITPELARVLRSKVLRKDRRWLVLEVAPSPLPGPIRSEPLSQRVLQVRPGGAVAVNPFEAESARPSHATAP